LSIKKSVSYEKIIFLEYLRRYFPFKFAHNVPIIRVSTQLESSPQLPYSQKKSSFSSSSSQQQQQQLNSQPTQYLKNKIDKNNSKKTQKKTKKEDNFGKKAKKQKQKQKKKHVGKAKAKFSTSSILK
jgi:molecular chaperone GrpE (heat shock protein)